MTTEKLLIIFGVLSVLFIAGCVQTQPTESQKTTSNLYKNAVYGFSMEYPKSWEIKESISVEGLTAIVAFMGPIENNFQTNINVKTENVQGYTLNRYIRASKTTIRNFFAMNDYILIDEGNLTIGGQNSYFLEYAYNLQGNPLKIKQVILMKGDNAYIITYTALQNTFENNVKDFDNSISTFEFIKKEAV